MNSKHLYKEMMGLQGSWYIKSVTLSKEIKQVTVPWADRYARVSLSMEAFDVDLLQACRNIKSVCKLTSLSWKTVDTIMKKAVERGLTRRAQVPMECLGLDEKSIEKGNSYSSILTDVSSSRVLNLVRGRTQETAQELLKTTLSQEQRASGEAVAMDMWPAYMCAVRETLPKASIVHDKFHVVKYLVLHQFNCDF